MKFGRTEPNSKAPTKTELNAVLEATTGPMEALISETGLITKSTGSGFTIGKMDAFIKARGFRIICMVSAFLPMRMAGGIKENSKRTRRRAMAFITGKMDALLKVSGLKGNRAE